MKNLLNAAVSAIVIGFLVGVVAFLLGQIPHLTFLATYDVVIGIVAGIIAFINRWDSNQL